MENYFLSTGAITRGGSYYYYWVSPALPHTPSWWLRPACSEWAMAACKQPVTEHACVPLLLADRLPERVGQPRDVQECGRKPGHRAAQLHLRSVRSFWDVIKRLYTLVRHPVLHLLRLWLQIRLLVSKRTAAPRTGISHHTLPLHHERTGNRALSVHQARATAYAAPPSFCRFCCLQLLGQQRL